MGTEKFMEEIRALGGTMDRKNWKSPKSENGEVSRVLHEADDFMGREGWRLPEREAPPAPEPREQSRVGVLAEEANAQMDRSGWTLDEGNPRATAQTLNRAASKLTGAAKLASKGKRKYAAYEIQDALQELARVFTELGVEGHPLRAAMKALMGAEDQLEGMRSALRGMEDPAEVVFSSKEKAQEFKKSLNPSEVRGKLSVKKTKGWKTYSVVLKPHSFADRAAFLKQYAPEKPHYKDIIKSLKEGIEEAQNPPAPAKSPEKAYRLSVTLARKQPLKAAKYALYGAILMAKKAQNKRLMVALSKAYQIVEEEVEKAEVG